MTSFARQIKALRKHLEMNQTQFAAHVGVEQPSVSRWERGTEPTFEHLRKLNKIAEDKGLPSLTGEVHAGSLASVPIIGSVRAGLFQEAVEQEINDWEYVEVGEDPRYRGLTRFALRVVGPSMNQRYPEGSFLICVKLADLGRDPKNQERVIVHRTNRDGMVEATCKELVVDGEGTAWLWPRSTDPRHQQPWRVDENPPDIESLEIHAIVVGSYQPE